ncbi:hypothetical protein TVAG_384080 [Trichomonas vaginalis G3]|uniref:DUF3447 domain-containing protein n=1 Tax=Trichomonas vaginalis (strain ATCC PRA-98 / G3) TaxID=412133 RepID=A2F0A7_TRIV3|nr:ankycorbin family [Trichomonas vaginalis G3]EAY01669.1 hypothetical protein TVAG_384080 [Trichomonas vaginalis G3]KAI5515701.1 ankycorbin family [Trichomonas vaginalis G3]|eukprot:XP_001314262.1 hypothetical protein [Trichomonas vaginalis G3]
MFLNYDRNNEEQTHKLVDFIENHVYTGLRELSTNIFLRPQKVKDYVHLYSLLSRNIKIISCHNFVCTPIFSHYLIKEGICSEFEAKQLSARLPNQSDMFYLHSFSEFINSSNCQLPNSHEIEFIESFIEDDLNKLVELTSATNFDYSHKIFQDGKSVSLINLSAMYGAIKCFKYLLVHNPDLQDICNYAVVGGNTEIIRILKQAGVNFNDTSIVSLYFRRDELFDWLRSETTEDNNQENQNGNQNQNQNHIEYSITETLSIKAIYSLTKKNPLLCINDWLSVFTLDGLVEPVRELSKNCMFSNSLFFLIRDEESLNNLLLKAPQKYFNKLISYSISKEYLFHLRFLIHHPKFDYIKIDKNIITEINNRYKNIYDEIQAIISSVISPEKAYQNFLHNLPINENIVFDLMKHCIQINDILTYNEVSKKYSYVNFSLEQLLELLKFSPFTWSFASKKIVEKEPDGSVCIPLTRYYFISEDNGIIPAQVADIIMKDPELQSQLTAYDCINLLSMIQLEYTDISPLISLLTKFGLISDPDYVSRLYLKNDIQEIVYQSPQIDQLIKEDVDNSISIIPVQPMFIKKSQWN